MDDKSLFARLDQFISRRDLYSSTKILALHMVLNGMFEGELMALGKEAGLDRADINNARIGGRPGNLFTWRSPTLRLQDPELIALADSVGRLPATQPMPPAPIKRASRPRDSNAKYPERPQPSTAHEA